MSNNKVRILIAVLAMLIVCVGSYIIYIKFSTYAWFIDGSYSISIDASRKTFGRFNDNGELIKSSKEYKEVLVIDGDIIAVIDNDDYVKILDENEKVVTTFKDKYPDAKFITSSILFSEPDILRLHFIERKEDITDIVYCYDRKTGKTFIEKS